MLLATNSDYVDLANQLIYISGQIYGILAFFVGFLAIWLVYKLFNGFF